MSFIFDTPFGWFVFLNGHSNWTENKRCRSGLSNPSILSTITTLSEHLPADPLTSLQVIKGQVGNQFLGSASDTRALLRGNVIHYYYEREVFSARQS
jgi:hypothetical protein